MKKFGVALIVLMLGFLTILYNRNEKPTKDVFNYYGKEHNDLRRQKYLPIIEESWAIRTHDSSHVQWSGTSRFVGSDTPEHMWKTLYFRESILVAEEDAFNYDRKDSISDRLIILLNLRNPDSTKFTFSRQLYRTYPPSKSQTVNFEFADSVLRTWHFKNLYRDLSH